MSRLEAVSTLFVAFGAHRNVEQARAYVAELEAMNACGECSQIAAENLIRSVRRLPSLAQLLTEISDVTDSDRHTAHIVARSFAPAAESWWRTTAVDIIAAHTGGDRDLASFIAAQMWFSAIPADPDVVAAEIRDMPVWLEAARAFTGDRDLPRLVGAAFERARWHAEHQIGDMPPEILNLGAPA